ncbi:ParB/RepB/Spo0J family partition protein [Oenococcus alcoholitolerans]|uniref:HTH cro/C1-type domain-containing protein n=1 Tax=Oenococcus alcoholitolerans TaxID=931074 RepID=A0ABR4XTD5_9LACO|nr:hypothetical protein Q757_01325 [Oenococcus alcoholitolerans]
MTNKRRGLGRGIDALFSDDESQADLKRLSAVDSGEINSDDSSVAEVDINRLAPNPYQPRKKFDKEPLHELAESIKDSGIIQPLIVRQRADSDTFQIVAGERRFLAAKDAGLKKIPVLIKKLTDQQMAELAIVENLQREDLDPIEEAEGIRQFMLNASLTQSQAADKIGKSRTALTNILRLLNLPEEIKDLLRNKTISVGHARALLSLDSKSDMVILAKKIIEKSLSVRQVEQLVKNLPGTKVRPLNKKPTNSSEDPFIFEAKERLEDKFATKVAIKNKHLEIDFVDEEDLNRILSILGVDF